MFCLCGVPPLSHDSDLEKVGRRRRLHKQVHKLNVTPHVSKQPSQYFGFLSRHVIFLPLSLSSAASMFLVPTET